METTSLAWGDAPTSRVPGWVYTDAALYREELERVRTGKALCEPLERDLPVHDVRVHDDGRVHVRLS